MKRTSDSIGTSFLILATSFMALGVLTIGLYSLSTFTGEYLLVLLTHLSGMLATAALIGSFVALALLLHTEKTSRYDKVLAALRYTLKYDEDATARKAAARGLANLDVELSTLHQEHDKLDNILISSLEGQEYSGMVIKQPGGDHDAGVRSEVARGLADLELEERSYYHQHNKLDDIIFESDL